MITSEEDFLKGQVYLTIRTLRRNLKRTYRITKYQRKSSFSRLFNGRPNCGYYAERYPEDSESVSLIAPAGFSKSIPEVKSWWTAQL